MLVVLGSALSVWHLYYFERLFSKNRDFMKGSYLGPSFKKNEIENELINCGAKYHNLDNQLVLLEKIVLELEQEKIVGCIEWNLDLEHLEQKVLLLMQDHLECKKNLI